MKCKYCDKKMIAYQSVTIINNICLDCKTKLFGIDETEKEDKKEE